MAQKKGKTDSSTAVLTADDKLNQELSALGFGNIVKLADQFCDMDVTCVPTGFPQLDYILHSKLRGFPLGRDIELYSREPELGKTSLSLEFLKAAQRHGYRTCYDDVERTMTLAYLKEQGLQIRPEEDPTKVAIRLMRHEKTVIPSEVWLDTLEKLSNVMDLIVVDSVAALEKKANLEKTTGEENQMGGISKQLSEFYRKNVAKRASIIWVNQMRTKIGAYSPTGATPLDTTGGKAIKFYSSIRVELSFQDKIKESKDGDPVGMRVKAFTYKNKLCPQWQQASLSYIFGYGFSPFWDYMEVALKSGIIDKKGSWLSFDGDGSDPKFGGVKAQGPLNFHNLMRGDPAMFNQIKRLVDGEDAVVEETVTQGERPADAEE